MIRIDTLQKQLPFYRPVPLTNLPLIYHREHLFPYPSYGDTETDAQNRAWRMVSLENEVLRVEVAPDLGGRVYSLYDKRLGKELLFSNPVVKPVRILPVWGFISGGIEFNFPIAHAPTSIAEVGCSSGKVDNYGYIRVGEREARTGMEWVVELGLHEGYSGLVQRTAFRNRTAADHPWMSWTICAVRSTSETEFIHVPHRVLVHNEQVRDLEWPGDGLNWDCNAGQMTALFFKPGSASHFGVYHHDLGLGLMHLGDPALLPGKKIWTYGHGRDRHWGQASTEGGLSYCEIESGPLLDQSEKPLFPRGTERWFEEHWIPVHSRAACDQVALPNLQLPVMAEPWLGYGHSPWQVDWEQFAGGAGPLPETVVPTGLELENPLRRALEKGNVRASEPLALWLALRGRTQDALRVLEKTGTPTARRLRGLILWKGLGQPDRARFELEAGPLGDPVAVWELDTLYEELGFSSQRITLLARAPDHRLVIERRAALALATGKPEETLRLLEQTPWPREHQRYVRSNLWRQARQALRQPETELPDSLGEDRLAPFGAYWNE